LTKAALHFSTKVFFPYKSPIEYNLFKFQRHFDEGEISKFFCSLNFRRCRPALQLMLLQQENPQTLLPGTSLKFLYYNHEGINISLIKLCITVTLLPAGCSKT
jgi:hypothetical protein